MSYCKRNWLVALAAGILLTATAQACQCGAGHRDFPGLRKFEVVLARGTSCKQARVEWTTDFKKWHLLKVVKNPGKIVRVVDDRTECYPYKFYRLVRK